MPKPVSMSGRPTEIKHIRSEANDSHRCGSSEADPLTLVGASTLDVAGLLATVAHALSGGLLGAVP
jgi:hypothetical protein